jgi:hypothetical protein
LVFYKFRIGLVLARPDNVDLTSFYSILTKTQLSQKGRDTEYDRKLLKAVTGACKSWKELEELGIDPRKINVLTTSKLSWAAECSNVHKASLDIVKQRLVSKIQQLQEGHPKSRGGRYCEYRFRYDTGYFFIDTTDSIPILVLHTMKVEKCQYLFQTRILTRSLVNNQYNNKNV